MQVFADALRSKGGIENRAAVLQGQRFELFRGKDLVRWVKAHPERGAAAAAGAAGVGCVTAGCVAMTWAVKCKAAGRCLDGLDV